MTIGKSVKIKVQEVIIDKSSYNIFDSVRPKIYALATETIYEPLSNLISWTRGNQ